MGKTVKVLQVFSAMNMGGAESRMMDVFRNIDRRRYRFDFLSMSLEPQYFEREVAELGGRFFKIRPPRESGILGNLKEMRQVMAEGRYDAVHAHTSFHCALATWAARLARVPVRIAHARTTGSMNASLLNRLFLSLGRFAMPWGTNVRLAISRDAGRYLFGKGRFRVLPNAIDCRKFQDVDPRDRERIRQEFGLVGRGLVIGMVGRFNQMKNHRFAVRWFAEFLKEKPDSVLVFIGESSYRRLDIPRMCDELGIGSSVRFAGVRSDVDVWMNVFDVLLVPSLFEGLGGVILEAQAAGCPVVKSDSFTNEADMGIGLVEQLSLDAGFASWSEAVVRAAGKARPGNGEINQAFAMRKYDLASEIDELGRIYDGGALDSI